MPLSSGTRLGPYEILSAIGAGGMGEVYRARDTKLNRDVALKVLPSEFTSDPERLARFKREAQVLASLDHPNIGAIYGFENADGIQALVLQLVEGPTLADQIAQGAIHIDEALPIARQIAEALEAAHEKGVIHRDLKPANVKVTREGTVKILDFGLAKLLDSDAVASSQARGFSPGLTNSPTITTPAMTMAGVILGTAAYMSPEQAKGRPADKRSDIWGFGCVLYEMLAGKRAFEGEDVSDTLAAVLRGEPHWNALPAQTPDAIVRLARRCLQKDPKRRLGDIHDAILEIEDGASPTISPREPSRALLRPPRTAWIAASFFLATTVAAIAAAYLLRTPADTHVFRAEIPLPLDLSPAAPASRMAVSPDGRQLAFIARSTDGAGRLWLRHFDSLSVRPLPGTEDASAVFWSSDNRSLAFIAGRRLKRLDPSGGSAIILADAPSSIPTPGSWNRDNVILFTPANDSPISRVSAAGGAVTAVTVLDKANGETRHAFPFFLPDHRHFLYAAFNGITPLGLYVASLDGKDKRQVLSGGSSTAYAKGHLLFVRDSTLMAQPFDAASFTMSGEPTPIADQVLVNQAAPRAGAFTVSQTGVLVYQSGSPGDLQLTWVDRAGRSLGVVGERANYGDVHLSVDGRYASVSATPDAGGFRDLWIVDVVRGTRTKFTFDAAEDHTGLWSPDSNRMLFNSARKGQLDIFEKSINGAGNESLVFANDRTKQLLSWSRDGRFVLVNIPGDKTGADVWALPLSNEGKVLTPFPYLQTPAQEGQAQFSPDGRWVAYSSNEAGFFQIYVGRFPEFGSKRLVSPRAGIFPRWRADGKEIYYLETATNKLMAATVTRTGDALDVTDVRPLFDIQLGGLRFPYDVAPDGRFLVNLLDRPVQAATLTMVVNWPALLKSPSSW